MDQLGDDSIMIARSVGLHDHLDASYGVIGKHLVVALLHDLHETGKVASYVRVRVSVIG